MVSEQDIEETLDNQTLDETLAKWTVVDISGAINTIVDARIHAAMDEWFWRLQNPPAILPAQPQPSDNQKPLPVTLLELQLHVWISFFIDSISVRY